MSVGVMKDSKVKMDSFSHLILQTHYEPSLINTTYYYRNKHHLLLLAHSTSIKTVSRRQPRKSLFTSPTLLKFLSGDTVLVFGDSHCLVMWTKCGNSCWCCFHHMKGSVCRGTPVALRGSHVGILPRQ
jgi:hypothetical protein